jgi:thiamine biosynthesis lipoprotein
MNRTEFRAMGSKMLAMLDADQPPPILADVPAWFGEWERTLSRFRLDSELTILNADAGVPRVVSKTLWDVLAVGIEAEELTGGLVSPLILEDLIAAGYDRTFDLLDKEYPLDGPAVGEEKALEAAQADPVPALPSIVVDGAAREVRLPPGFGLDFGGVAKGWAAHQAMRRLSAAGPALVSAGGDVAVSGPLRSGDAWQIGLEDPFRAEGYIETIYLEGGGVATSGKDHRYWRRGGVFQHHIIDPRTRQPASTDIMTATVVARTVMQAEALAKAVLISGSDAGLQMIDDLNDAEAILVLDNRRMLYSRNIETYL